MTANVNIIRVGNSQGIIIPAKFLKKLSLTEKDSLEISECDGGFSLKKVTTKQTNPFDALDNWNLEHGYNDSSLEEISDYIENLRSCRSNKEIVQW